MKRLFSTAAAVLLTSACLLYAAIHTDYDHKADFSRYHTYSWIGVNAGNSLWQTMTKGGEIAKGIDGWDHLFHKVGEYAGQLIEWLANNSG